ncbi:ABC transporter permease [Shimia sp. Alg240-R146]|uniref:ABC transporter permease n=1 Tax=Shimia sp. Alg240-R146 TaxID=2993449 RepID=UPI0022E86299|nr:ABC transporter permease [Shimia sp. Alg240-R146]
MLFRLAFKSLLSRILTVSLTIFAIALSVALFLGVEKVRTGAKASFADTISGTDLIVGARSGGVQLLLYSVFRVGNATNNVTWQSYQDIANRDEVEWIVPLSLGDSHRGFRVLGTTAEFFDRYKYRGGRDVQFVDGLAFGDLFDAVIGADVAAALDYTLGDEIIVAHGIASFTEHDDKPFKVSGVLKKTGTPVDRTVFVSLEAIEAIHIDWQGGGRSQNTISAEDVRQMELKPKAVTAALVGVTSRLKIFGLQRWVNEYSEEPLLAILPGVALSELWSLIGVAETALVGVSIMVVITALLGMVAMIFSGLNERRREMALLRAIGARPRTILMLLTTEAALMSFVAVLLGVTLLYTGLFVARSHIDAAFGLYLDITWPTAREYIVLALVVVAGTAVSLIPALRAYFLSLADGMQVRN